MRPTPYQEERPWGWFRRFIHNASSTVKILNVKAGEEFSLQKHFKREEFWHVLSGKGVVIIGNEEFKARPGDEFFVPIKTAHRIRAAEDASIRVLEIALGDFEEDDIIRLQDKYNRDT